MRLKKSIFSIALILGIFMVLTSSMTFSANSLYYSKDKIEYTNKESLKLSGSITSVTVSPSVLNLSISTSLTIMWSSTDVNFVEIYLLKGGSNVAGPWGPYSSSPDGGSTVRNLGGYQSGTDYEIKVQDDDDSSVSGLSGYFEITKYVPPSTNGDGDEDEDECEEDSDCGSCYSCEEGECEWYLTDIETVLIIVPLMGIISITIVIIHRKFKSQNGDKYGTK